MNLKNDFQENWKGLLSIFGAFLLQLCVGSFHGTFGNLLPYITSYLRQVNMFKHNPVNGEYVDKIILYWGLWWCQQWGRGNDHVNWRIGSRGQLSAGLVILLRFRISFSIPGGLIFVPSLGPRACLALASLLFSLAPVFTWITLTYLDTRDKL